MSAATIIQPPAAPPLTQAEQRILSAFRNMDAHTQRTTVIVAEAWASANLVHKRPSLSIVQGGTA